MSIRLALAITMVGIAGFSLFAAPLPDASSVVKPVTAQMKVLTPDVRAGAKVEVSIVVDISSPYHIYAPGEPPDRSIPLSVKLELPKGFTLAKDWSFPPPTTTASGDLIYTGSIEIRCTLKVPQSLVSGTVSLKGELNCQACDEDVCWPPRPIPLSTTIHLHPASP